MGLCSSCCREIFDLAPPINPDEVDLSHFDLHRVLGKGGFGKVQVIESRLNGQFYALKSMDKAWLLQSSSNVRSVWLERHIGIQLRSPFLVPIHYAFQDASHLYLVLHFMPGGDLHFLLYQETLARGKGQHPKPLPEEHVKFYMAEILLGLEEMHSVGIVYRDLKPDNCLLDAEGHVRLSDFGLAGDLNAEPTGLTIGACGTSGYMSQELLANMQYDFTPDVWAFGVVMYELLHGYVPPSYDDPVTLHYRSKLSSDAVNLLTSLLQHDPGKRIGCDINRHDRWSEVKNHSWFKEIDWEKAAARALHPPFKPTPNIANCDPFYELEEQLTESHLSPPPSLTAQEQSIFQGWNWHTEPEYHTQFTRLDDESSPSASSSSLGGPLRESIELIPTQHTTPSTLHTSTSSPLYPHDPTRLQRMVVSSMVADGDSPNLNSTRLNPLTQSTNSNRASDSDSESESESGPATPSIQSTTVTSPVNVSPIDIETSRTIQTTKESTRPPNRLTVIHPTLADRESHDAPHAIEVHELDTNEVDVEILPD